MYRSTCLIVFLAVVACAYAAPAGETTQSPSGGSNSGSKLENRPVSEPLPLLEKQTTILETPRRHQLAPPPPPPNAKLDSDSAEGHDSSSEDSDLDTDATHHHYGYYAYYAPGWSGWVGRTYGWHDGWRTHYVF